MRQRLFAGIAALALLTSVACCPYPIAHAQVSNHSSVKKTSATKGRQGQIAKIAIHVSDSDPQLMNLALNNVKNIDAYYKAKKQKVAIEVVTYGPGLAMVRADNNPVKQRVETMSLEMPHLTFAACGNTIANTSKKEGKQVKVLSEAKVVPSGVIRLIELQQQGYAYLRP